MDGKKYTDRGGDVVMKWKYTLKSGTELRKAINSGDNTLDSCRKTIDALKACFYELMSLLPDDEHEDFIIEYYEVKDHCNILHIDNDAEREDQLLVYGYDGFEPMLDMINHDLELFYNICDDHSVWIEL